MHGHYWFAGPWHYHRAFVEVLMSRANEEALNFSLVPNESVTFRYRVLIRSEIASPDSTEAAYQSFIAAYH
jgi:hypothetical protein